VKERKRERIPQCVKHPIAKRDENYLHLTSVALCGAALCRPLLPISERVGIGKHKGKEK